MNALVYAMGDKSDDILHSFKLTNDQQKDYDTVKVKYDGYFVKKSNVIYERAKFNRRAQDQGESVDDFITDAYP